MLEEILPQSAAVAATTGDILDVPLFAEEEALVGAAVEKRRREFTTARACARTALAQLGVPAQPILSGDRGEPRWPTGIVGSITHCNGYRACAVARAADLLTIGVDAEPDERLPAGVLDEIALPDELEWVRALAGRDPQISWDRLLFCMKESIYKAWFPLAGRWLGFEDAAIALDSSSDTFSAQLLVPGPTVEGRELTSFSGRWLARGGVLLAAIALPAK